MTAADQKDLNQSEHASFRLGPDPGDYDAPLDPEEQRLGRDRRFAASQMPGAVQVARSLGAWAQSERSRKSILEYP